MEDIDKIQKVIDEVGEKELEIGEMSPQEWENEQARQSPEDRAFGEHHPEEESPEGPLLEEKADESGDQELEELLKDIEVGLSEEKELYQEMEEREGEPDTSGEADAGFDEMISREQGGAEQPQDTEAEVEEKTFPEAGQSSEEYGQSSQQDVSEIEPEETLEDISEIAEGTGETEEAEEGFDLPEDFNMEDLALKEGPSQASSVAGLGSEEAVQTTPGTGQEKTQAGLQPEVSGPGEAAEQTAEPAGEQPGAELEEEETESFDEEFEMPDMEDLEEIEQEQEPVAETTEEEEEAFQQPVAAQESPGSAEGGLELSDEDIVLVKTKLKQLQPALGARIKHIIINESISSGDMRGLLDLLIKDAPESEIGSFVERTTGEKPVPPERPSRVIRVERKAAVFENLLQNVGPLARVAALSVAILALLGVIFGVFIYKPMKANRYYELGIQNIQNARYEQAEENFQRAVNIHEKIKEYDNFGWAYMVQANFDAAEKKFSKGIDRDPGMKNISLRLHLAKLYNILERYARADRIYDRVLQQHPRVYKYLELKGENLIDWGKNENQRLDQAYQLFEEAFADDSDNPGPLFKMLHINVMKDERQDIDRLYNYISRVFPDAADKQAYTALASYYISSGLLDPVKSILEKVLNNYPEYPQAYYAAANYYGALNLPKKQEEFLKAVIEKETSREIPYPWEKRNRSLLSRAYTGLGKIYANSTVPGSAAEAIRYFTRAIEQDEGNGDAYFNLAQVYFYDENNYQAAKKNYLKAESLGYSTEHLQYNLGVIYFYEEQFSRAVNYWSELTQSEQANPNVIFAMGVSFLNMGKYNLALGEFLRLSQKYDQLVENLGEVKPWKAYHKRILLEASAVYNNLGVAFQKMYEQSGNPDYQKDSLVALYKAGEFADIIGMERGKIQYNVNYIMHPEVVRSSMAVDEDISESLRFKIQ
ncbi:MAG: periplasmic flagellar collar protein FlcA [Spirochaetota bacterium]